MEYEEVLKIFNDNDKVAVGTSEDIHHFNVYKDSLTIPQIIINDTIYIMLRSGQSLHCSGYSGWFTDANSGLMNINIKDIVDIKIK